LQAFSPVDMETPLLALRVQSGRELVEVSVASNSSVAQLKAALAPLTATLPRNMKLLHKGKVLLDSAKLDSLGVKDGDKVLLLGAVKSLPSRVPAPTAAQEPASAAAVASAVSSRTAAWRATGLVSLSGLRLVAVPEEVWTLGAALRVLDVSDNPLGVVPAQLCVASSLRILSLCCCGLSSLLLPLSSASTLHTLKLDNNRLTSLPHELGQLAALRTLSLKGNQLSSLPSSLGSLVSLTTLDASSNLLADLPEQLSLCRSLELLAVSSNRLSALPASLSACPRLSTIEADSNNIGAAGVPVPLLRADSLHRLSLRNNPLTMALLRELDGFAEFESRRRAKAQQALRTAGSTGFDECADAEMRR